MVVSGITRQQRLKASHFPVFLAVRVTQRQADAINEVKAKTELTDSDIMREALEQWLNTTLHALSEKVAVE